MNIKPFLIAGVAITSVMFGLYLYIFPAETEYLTPPATAYVDGATPPQIKNWEMY